MYYDIASKVILSRCKEPFLTFFCGLPVKTAYLIEPRPQETTSLRRSDFVLRVLDENQSEFLVLLEFVSSWKPWLPLRTLECRCRHILQESLPVKSFLVLLTETPQAKAYYQDEEVRYSFGLVKIYEIPAKEVLEEGPECLLAFVPLMKEGEKYLEEAERRIYEGPAPREKKADLLTGMAILGGLISEEIPIKLIERRRDLMIESAAYEIIKREGYEEGLKQGLQQGIQQGLLRAIKIGLELKFGPEGLKIYPEIKKIQDVDVLEAISEALTSASSLEEIRKIYI